MVATAAKDAASNVWRTPRSSASLLNGLRASTRNTSLQGNRVNATNHCHG